MVCSQQVNNPIFLLSGTAFEGRDSPFLLIKRGNALKSYQQNLTLSFINDIFAGVKVFDVTPSQMQ